MPPKTPPPLHRPLPLLALPPAFLPPPLPLALPPALPLPLALPLTLPAPPTLERRRSRCASSDADACAGAAAPLLAGCCSCCWVLCLAGAEMPLPDARRFVGGCCRGPGGGAGMSLTRRMRVFCLGVGLVGGPLHACKTTRECFGQSSPDEANAPLEL